MRNIIIALFVTIASSCTEPQIVVIEPIGLGENPQVNAIIGYSIVNNTAHIKAKTTIGAKYSLQLSKLGQSEPLKAQGFTAKAEESNLVISFDKTEAGIYDLILLDISGNASKLPINIK
jgi:hypothetical protein